MHTSQFSMGVDVADINNDAYPEIVSVDMLPSDPYILKRSLGDDAYDIFRFKIGVGYSFQFTRNNLQYNRRNGLFSEVGLYSGIAATDWSWAPLWMDFDNDGWKDIFISNGIPPLATTFLKNIFIAWEVFKPNSFNIISTSFLRFSSTLALTVSVSAIVCLCYLMRYCSINELS